MGRTTRMWTETFPKLRAGPFRPPAPLPRPPGESLEAAWARRGATVAPRGALCAAICRPPHSRKPVAPARPPLALRMCEGMSWQRQLDGRPEASLLQQEPRRAARLDPAQPQKQEGLMGENVSAVSAPGEDLLPTGGRGEAGVPGCGVWSTWPCSVVHEAPAVCGTPEIRSADSCFQ